MDILNNLNVVISIVIGVFGIGGYIIGIIAYLRNKVTSSQQQTMQRPSSQRSYSQAVPITLSKLDWMEVLWAGFEDCFRARSGGGCMAAFFIWFPISLILLFIATTTSVVGWIIFAVFNVIYFTFLILFYVYFVGRRVEMKVGYLSQLNTQIY